jgi:hypothetical protein
VVISCLPTAVGGEAGPDRFPLPSGPLAVSLAARCPSTFSPPACTIWQRPHPLPARSSPPPPRPGGEAYPCLPTVVGGEAGPGCCPQPPGPLTVSLAGPSSRPCSGEEHVLCQVLVSEHVVRKF